MIEGYLLPAAKIGVYRLIHRGEVVYVGASTNLLSRLSSWVSAAAYHIDFDAIEIFPVSRDALAATELAHIKEHLPKHNRAGVSWIYNPPRLPNVPVPLLSKKLRDNSDGEFVASIGLVRAGIAANKPDVLRMVDAGLIPPPAHVSGKDKNDLPIYKWRRQQVIEWLESLEAAA